jgi:hypothetical protein
MKEEIEKFKQKKIQEVRNNSKQSNSKKKLYEKKFKRK